MNIGKQIRTHRQRANMTQEKLAEALNVTAQAVSKWENEVGCPDISLLPELSAALGITIDELFESSEETHLRRIENMLDYKLTLTHEDYIYAKTRLEELSLYSKLRPRALSLLSQLYMHRSDSFRETAKQAAVSAIEAEQSHSNYAALNSAYEGCRRDWSFTNHRELIDILKRHIEHHPESYEAYLWLIYNLIDDGRFAEAEIYIEKMHEMNPSRHDYLCPAMIKAAREGFGADKEILDKMIEEYPEDDCSWFSRGNLYAKRGQYREALSDFRRAAELEKPPRFTDTEQSIADICLITGDIAGAIAAYTEVVKILREDWKTPEGEQINEYLEKIEKLRTQA